MTMNEINYSNICYLPKGCHIGGSKILTARKDFDQDFSIVAVLLLPVSISEYRSSQRTN